MQDPQAWYPSQSCVGSGGAASGGPIDGYIDGGYVGDATGLFGSGESTAQCPNNVCAGPGTDSKGQTVWAQYYVFTDGTSGYFNPQQMTNGINTMNGMVYNDANFQTLLKQQYASQIASQCGTVAGNLAADAPSGSGASVVSCNAGNIQGGNANFQVNCGDWNNGNCAGRWDGGLHIEAQTLPSGDTIYWAHNDAASPYIGASFNWATFNPWNLVVHFTVDVLAGNTVYYVLPH